MGREILVMGREITNAMRYEPQIELPEMKWRKLNPEEENDMKEPMKTMTLKIWPNGGVTVWKGEDEHHRRAEVGAFEDIKAACAAVKDVVKADIKAAKEEAKNDAERQRIRDEMQEVRAQMDAIDSERSEARAKLADKLSELDNRHRKLYPR